MDNRNLKLIRRRPLFKAERLTTIHGPEGQPVANAEFIGSNDGLLLLDSFFNSVASMELIAPASQLLLQRDRPAMLKSPRPDANQLLSSGATGPTVQ